MDQEDKDLHASLDACILELTYDLWQAGSVTENRYREVLAGIVERRRQRLGPSEARRTPIPFPQEFVAECKRQAMAVAAHDPGGAEIDTEIALLQEWPEN